MRYTVELTTKIIGEVTGYGKRILPREVNETTHTYDFRVKGVKVMKSLNPEVLFAYMADIVKEKVAHTEHNKARAFGEAVIGYIRQKMRDKKTGRVYTLPDIITVSRHKGNYISNLRIKRSGLSRKRFLQEEIGQYKISRETVANSGSNKLKRYIRQQEKLANSIRPVIYKKNNKNHAPKRFYRASSPTEYPAYKTGFLYRGMYYTILRGNKGYVVQFIFEPDYSDALMAIRPFLIDAIQHVKSTYSTRGVNKGK